MDLHNYFRISERGWRSLAQRERAAAPCTQNLESQGEKTHAAAAMQWDNVHSTMITLDQCQNLSNCTEFTAITLLCHAKLKDSICLL